MELANTSQNKEDYKNIYGPPDKPKPKPNPLAKNLMEDDEDQETSLNLDHIKSVDTSLSDNPLDSSVFVIDNILTDDQPLFAGPMDWSGPGRRNDTPMRPAVAANAGQNLNNLHLSANHAFYQIGMFITIIYQYIRMLLSAGLFFYAVYLYFFNDDPHPDVFYSLSKPTGYSNPHPGSAHLMPNHTKLNPLPLYSGKDLRIIIAVSILLFFGLSSSSVMLSLFHRKTLTHLKFTFFLSLLFALNLSDEEYNLRGVTFVSRERESRLSRLFFDLFYGVAIRRSPSLVVRTCYAIFGFVFYPNLVVFVVMTLLFVLTVVVIAGISFTNWIGWTRYDLDDRNRPGTRGRGVGLSRSEISRLPCEQFSNKHSNTGASTAQGDKSNESGVHCSICYMPFENSDFVITLPECEHMYHKDCITNWFKTHTTCPVCRTDIKKILQKNNKTFDLFDKMNHSMIHLSWD